MKAKDDIVAWHFTNGPKLRDGRPLPARGKWLRHTGRVVMCKSGLHASIDILDALNYAPGAMLHRVTCRNIVEAGDDKLVCRSRRIDASANMTAVLVQWANECAQLSAWCAASAASIAAARAATRAAACAATYAATYAAARVAACAAADAANAANAAATAATAYAARDAYAAREHMCSCIRNRLIALFEQACDETPKGDKP